MNTRLTNQLFLRFAAMISILATAVSVSAADYVNGARVDGAEPGEWTHDWDAATAAAKKDGKPVFVNFTGSDWCGWCQHLKRKVFSQPEWGAWASNHVYLVHVDFPHDKDLVPERHRERNREIASRYGVRGYPTCYLVDSATLEPLARFGASEDVTAPAFVAKVSAAMPGAESPTDDGTSGTPGKLPLDRFPSRGRIAWFDFAEGTADKVRPDRSFELRNVATEDGALRFNGVYVHSLAGRTNGCNAALRVPEMDRDGFSVGLSFRPERVAGDDLPLLNFGNAYRWFYAHLGSDGRLRFGLNCHDVRLPTEGLAANRKWNWFVCSLDVPSKTLRCVLNGVRLKDVRLPADFAWKTTPAEFRAKGLGTVDTTYWNGGEAFKGDLGAFVLLGRPLGEDELASLCSTPASRDNEAQDSSRPVPSATGAAEPATYVNGARVDGAEPGEWTHDWDAATAAAKKDGKPVFVNFTGSDWCGWCKLLKRQVFTQPEWGAWASNHVYLVHLDFPNDKALVPEKYRERNRELSRRYKVGGYPTCYLLDPATLEPLGRFGASRDANAADFVEKVSDAMPGVKKKPHAESAESAEGEGGDGSASRSESEEEKD